MTRSLRIFFFIVQQPKNRKGAGPWAGASAWFLCRGLGELVGSRLVGRCGHGREERERERERWQFGRTGNLKHFFFFFHSVCRPWYHFASLAVGCQLAELLLTLFTLAIFPRYHRGSLQRIFFFGPLSSSCRRPSWISYAARCFVPCLAVACREAQCSLC